MPKGMQTRLTANASSTRETGQRIPECLPAEGIVAANKGLRHVPISSYEPGYSNSTMRRRGMTAFGTNAKCRDVRCSVAMGWKADIIGSL